jgi:hypothetical protein
MLKGRKKNKVGLDYCIFFDPNDGMHIDWASALCTNPGKAKQRKH